MTADDVDPWMKRVVTQILLWSLHQKSSFSNLTTFKSNKSKNWPLISMVIYEFQTYIDNSKKSFGISGKFYIQSM